MARTPSNMISLGSTATPFTLPDTISNNNISLADHHGEIATVIMFICNHCPFVKHVNIELVRLAQDYDQKGISFIAISSNDVSTHPEDGPEKMRETGLALGYPFPYLYDETQEVAKAYQAACTPDFFIYDSHLKLAYRGQLDDSRPGNDIPVNGRDIRMALEAMQKGQPVEGEQKPSIGCNIKWK